MPQTYKFSYVNGHIVAEIDGKKCLIDTGSPVSIGLLPKHISDREEGPKIPGFDLDEISRHVGCKLDALIGGDILRLHVIQLSLLKKELIFTLDRADKESGCGLYLRMVNTIPTFEMMIAGKKVQAVLDTGARISYVAAGLIGDAPRTANQPEHDFYPGHGEFETYGHELPFRLCEANSRFVFHELPPKLAALFTAVQCEAIIGMDWFSKFSPSFVQISYHHKMMDLTLISNE